MPDLLPPGAAKEVRLDKWLWAARFFKSRTLAAQACVGGKVDVNGQAAKPHMAVRVGDLIRISSPHWPLQIKVAGLSTHRGPASEAQKLYEDLTPPRPPRPPGELLMPALFRPRGSGRPTKRERRRLEQLRSP